MDENNVQAAETAVTAESTPLTVVGKDKPKKPVTKKRTAEQLNDVAPAKMTEAEKIDYIKHLRETCNLHAQQAHAYQENAQRAFEQARKVNDLFEEYKIKAQAKLNFARQCVDHCRTSILLAGPIEE